jgi:hypothetical protein
MSIRAIAQELYTCQSRVHKLQDSLERAKQSEKDSIRQELRVAQAELTILRKILAGRKEHSLTTKKYSFPLK